VIEYHYLNGYLYRITGEEDSSGFCLEHWRADEYDALGRMKQDTLGKIVQTTRSYDQAQGTLENIKSDLLVASGATVQNLTYQYDNVGNVDHRERGLVGDSNYKLESFEYDELHRLDKHTVSSQVTTVVYDAIGNIKSKSDVGSYEYNGSGPHAVSKVTSPLGQYDPIARFQTSWEWNGETVTQNQADIVDTLNNYSYDANGNITQQGNRAITWTAFDKPASMTLEGQSGNYRGSQIEYDAQFQRIWKREGVFNSTGTLQSTKQTTVYIGKEYERISEYGDGTTAGDVKHRYTINTGSNIVQIERLDGSSTDDVKYMLTDNLGSTNILLNASAVVVQELEFDPWGMRTTETGQTGGNVNGITNRGYTGHETDDEVGLVNMNARIYDPYLGRFLSADPLLPDAGDMQAYNRYSYVYNNPLRYVDPTGNNPGCAGHDNCKGKRPEPDGDLNGSNGGLASGGAGGGGGHSRDGESRGNAVEAFNQMQNENENQGQSTVEIPDDSNIEEVVVTVKSIDRVKVTRLGSRLTTTINVVTLSNDLVIYATNDYVDAISNGQFVFSNDPVTKTFSLQYFGNQFHSAKAIEGLKSGSIALSKVGEFAGKFGNVLTVVSTGITLNSYRNGELSTSRTTFRLIGTAASVGVSIGAGPVAGIAVGSVFAATEAGFDLVNNSAKYVSGVVTNPGFVNRLLDSLGRKPSISGF